MAKEIERKFLVLDDTFKQGITPLHLHQGFISTEKENVVRVRIADKEAFLTLKTDGPGIARQEYDYEIPLEDAREILNSMCGELRIDKDRYLVEFEGHTWEVDEFHGDNEGLVVAELELETEDEAFPKPPWLGDEVTEDKRYFNANLVQKPYSSW